MNKYIPKVIKHGESIAKYSVAIYLKHFCTSTPERGLVWGGSTNDILFTKLQRAVSDCKEDELWGVFREFKSVYGFPPPSVLSKLICGLSYSLGKGSLPKACNIVFKIAKENSNLLQADSMSTLCLSLSRAQMPIPTSKILRLMLMKKVPPRMDVLCSIFMHMVKTDAGIHLASNILLEFCDHHLSAKNSECAMSMKPSTTIFNLVLEACMKVGSSVKAEQIIDAMARIGVVADLHSMLLFSHIYESNGQRDELKKFKAYIDRVSVLAQHYYPFYDKLLRLHFKFDDLDSAEKLVEEIYFHWDTHRLKQNSEDLIRPHMVPVGSPYLLEGLKHRVIFELLQKDSLFRVVGEEDLLVCKNGSLVLTNKGLAQLVVKYKRNERIGDLSKLLAAIEKMGDSEDDSICSDVIHACIYSSFLETAHDILDDMEIANISVPSTTYMVLLNAYCRDEMPKEAEALAKQIKRLGLMFDESDEMMISKCLLGEAPKIIVSSIRPTSSRQSELTGYLIQEMRKDDIALSTLYELNSSIYFFCKAKMLEDARKIYRTMQEINIKPTVQTFAYLIQAYSSLEDYREITILWGDIKRHMARGCSLAHRDLYELLLLNFLRGGYFERVLEVLGLMKDHGMYADRWLYKNEFVRHHKNLYRKLKATDAVNEAQRLRIEHVKTFRMWVRNN